MRLPKYTHASTLKATLGAVLCPTNTEQKIHQICCKCARSLSTWRFWQSLRESWRLRHRQRQYFRQWCRLVMADRVSDVDRRCTCSLYLSVLHFPTFVFAHSSLALNLELNFLSMTIKLGTFLSSDLTLQIEWLHFCFRPTTTQLLSLSLNSITNLSRSINRFKMALFRYFYKYEISKRMNRR